MKALLYRGPRDVEFVDIPKPKPGPGEVVVKVAYNGICGTDVHAYSMPGIFQWELVLGHESVGYVDEVGADIDFIEIGERVAVGPPGDCGSCYSCNTGNPNTCVNAFPNTLGIGPNTQGAYAEYVLSRHPRHELFKIPDGVSFEQAVLFDVLGVGFHAVRRSEFRLGDSAIVSGCGSIGLATIQALKIGGANPLIALDPLPFRRKMALEVGADLALDPTDPAQLEQAGALCASSNGAQVTFEAAGHPSSVQTCLDLLMPSGQVMLIGSDARPFQLVTAAIGHRQYDLKLSFTYTKEEIAKLFSLISAGKLDTSAYTLQKAPLAQAIKKLEALANGKLEVARVLLMPHGEI